MKKDYIISLVVLLITVGVVYLVTRHFFLDFASEYKLAGGFVKFFFLASIGDFIAYRIRKKEWKVPAYIFAKAIVWGLIGISIVLMFKIFPVGVLALQSEKILPFEGISFFFAFFVSALMNFTYAPTMMAFHRLSDTYFELRKNDKEITIGKAIEHINWREFINFTVFKTIPLFWVPAHTITFLLPEEYRVVVAALLGIVLGMLLGLFKNDHKQPEKD